ncbi:MULTISPECIES: hypothetical protein [unclassified Streptomyces]|uniref:hypothetical protein n=1 Tax=unclassified Streptomyces TaxID=2593676 RepID=UPI0015A5826D|nr:MULTISPECIES: hypothetical protein [unclassified Streptomyces]
MTYPVRRWCVHCGRLIEGEAVAIPGFSASGARPDAYRHPTCRAPTVRPRSYPTS